MATTTKEHPFFISWTSQEHPLTFDVEKVDSYHFISGDHGILDFLSTSFQATFGHQNQEIIQAISDQARTMSIASPKAIFPLKEDYSQRLLNSLKLDGKIFYTLSGSEAVENALKVARQYTGRKTIGARHNCYHGATLGAVSVTGDWRHKDVFVVDDYTLRIPDPSQDPDGTLCVQTIEQYGPQKVAALIIETTVGANGIHKTTQKWMDTVNPYLKDKGILLILDEVICGFGRTGSAFGFHQLNVDPDLICLAKGMTGGYFPMGSVWFHKSIADHYKNNVLSCGLTNYAHPIGLTASMAVMELMEKPEFFPELSGKISHFSKKLDALGSDFKVRHHGLMAAIEGEFNIAPATFYQAGLHLMSKPGQLILAPALTMPLDLIDKGFAIIESLLKGNQNE